MKTKADPSDETPPEAMPGTSSSPADFCRRHNICLQTYQAMQRNGLGPAEMLLSPHTLRITYEDEQAWIEQAKQRRAVLGRRVPSQLMKRPSLLDDDEPVVVEEVEEGPRRCVASG